MSSDDEIRSQIKELHVEARKIDEAVLILATNNQPGMAFDLSAKFSRDLLQRRLRDISTDAKKLSSSLIELSHEI